MFSLALGIFTGLLDFIGLIGLNGLIGQQEKSLTPLAYSQILNWSKPSITGWLQLASSQIFPLACLVPSKSRLFSLVVQETWQWMRGSFCFLVPITFCVCSPLQYLKILLEFGSVAARVSDDNEGNLWKTDPALTLHWPHWPNTKHLTLLRAIEIDPFST